MHGFSKQQEDLSKDLTAMTEIHFLPDIQWKGIVAVIRFRRDTEEKLLLYKASFKALSVKAKTNGLSPVCFEKNC